VMQQHRAQITLLLAPSPLRGRREALRRPLMVVTEASEARERDEISARGGAVLLEWKWPPLLARRAGRACAGRRLSPRSASISATISTSGRGEGRERRFEHVKGESRRSRRVTGGSLRDPPPSWPRGSIPTCLSASKAETINLSGFRECGVEQVALEAREGRKDADVGIRTRDRGN
jgi:hypothetical protein